MSPASYKKWLKFVCWTDINGPHGTLSVICMVSVEQGCDSFILVWNTFQGDVPTMGVASLQSRHKRRVGLNISIDLVVST